MPSIDWFWLIAGILIGKFALDVVIGFLMSITGRLRGSAQGM